MEYLAEPFGDRVTAPFPYVVTDLNGDIVAYVLSATMALKIAEALNVKGGS